MHNPSKVKGRGQAKGVRQLPGQRQRRVIPLQRLVRVAEQPQGPGRIAIAIHPRVTYIQKGVGAMLSGVIEGHALLLVRSGTRELAKKEQSLPLDAVSFQEECGVWHT